MNKNVFRKPAFMKACLLLTAVMIMIIQACVTLPKMKIGNEFLIKKEYIKAVQTYEEALLEAESAKTRAEIEKKIAETKLAIADKFIAKAAKMYGMLEKATVLGIEQIISSLEEVVRWDDEEERIAKKIEQYRAEAKRLLSNATELQRRALLESEKYRYESALGIMKKALQIDSSNKALQRAEKKLLKRKGHYDRTVAYLDESDLDKAVAEFRSLSKALPQHPSITDSPLKNQVMGLIEEKVDKLELENKWFEAIDYLKSFKGVEKNIEDVKRNGADYYYGLARGSIVEEKDYHKAYVYSLMAIKFKPDSVDIFNIHKEAIDRVDKSIQKHIAVASFDSPSNDPDAGKQFSDSLISYLYQVLPYGINILERDKIDFVLKEHQNEAKNISESLGVDLVVTGTVSLFKVDTNIDKRTGTVKVEIGEEIVENPEFSQMVKLYGTDMTQWPEVPDKTIEKKTYELLKYTKGTGRKKGFAKVSIRIFDTHKGTIVFVKDYEASVAKTSMFQDEVEAVSIKYIPLNLPTDTEIKEEIRKKVVSEIAKVVEASFEKREVRFLNQAKFYLDRKETDAAIKPLAEGHVYCKRANVSRGNASFLEINRLIDEIIR